MIFNLFSSHRVSTLHSSSYKLYLSVSDSLQDKEEEKKGAFGNLLSMQTLSLAPHPLVQLTLSSS